MNSYDPGKSAETNATPKLEDSAPNEKVSIWLLSFATGSVMWISLFLGMGFDSDFGTQLTRIYGHDLQDANMDWWLFMVIVITLSMFLHIGTWNALSRVNDNARAIFTVLVGGIGLLVAVLSVAFYIDSELVRLFAITLPTIVLCEYTTVRGVRLQ